MRATSRSQFKSRWGAGAFFALALFYSPVLQVHGSTDPTPDEQIQLSESFHRTSARIGCGLQKELYKNLEREDLEALRNELKESLALARKEARVAAKGASRAEKAILRQQVKVLERWVKSTRPQDDFQNALNQLCNGALHAVAPAARESALLAETVVLITTLPLRLTSMFIRGVISGKRSSEATTRLKSAYDRLGPSRNIGRHTLLSLATAAAQSGITGAVALPAVSVTLATDILISYRCQFAGEWAEAELKSFCSEWENLKSRFTKAASKGREAGAWVHDAIGRKLVFRSDRRPSESLCRSSWPHQVRVARRIYQRHRKRIQALTQIEPVVLPPGPARECVQLGFTVPTQEEAARVASGLGKVIDGIVVHVQVSAGTSSEPAPVKENLIIGVAETCTWVSTLQRQSDLRTGVEAKLMGLQSILEAQSALVNPKLHAVPVVQQFKVSASQVFRAPSPAVTRYRNVILALGPSEAEYDRFKADRHLLQKAREIQGRHQSFSLILKKLLRTRGRAECESLVRETGFSQEAWNQSAQELEKETLARQVYEFDHLEKYLSKSLARTQLRWELHTTNHLREVQKIITAPDVANILIVSHGLGSGHIRDSAFNEFPSSFFSEISPSVQTLGFYNCHSEKLTEIYGLKRTLTESASHHALRTLVTVPETELYRKTGVTPLESIGFFLERLDLHATDALRGSDLAQRASGSRLSALPARSSRLCVVEPESGVMGEGSYGVSLGQKFLGVMDRSDSRIEFNCEDPEFMRGDVRLSVKNLLTRNERPIISPRLLLHIPPGVRGEDAITLKVDPSFSSEWKVVYRIAW